MLSIAPQVGAPCCLVVGRILDLEEHLWNSSLSSPSKRWATRSGLLVVLKSEQANLPFVLASAILGIAQGALFLLIDVLLPPPSPPPPPQGGGREVSQGTCGSPLLLAAISQNQLALFLLVRMCGSLRCVADLTLQ